MFAHVTMFNVEKCNFWCEVAQRNEMINDPDWYIIDDTCVGNVPGSAPGSYLFYSGKNGSDETSDVYTLYADQEDVPDHVWAAIMKGVLCSS